MRALTSEEFQSVLIASGLIRSEASHLIGQSASQFRAIKFKRGATFSKQGDEPKWLGVIEQGGIRQTYLENGRSYTLVKYQPFQLICANELARKSTFYEFNAIEDTVIRVIKASTMKEWIFQDILQDSYISGITLPELFEVLRSNREYETISTRDLLDFCRATCSHDLKGTIEVFLQKPDAFQIPGFAQLIVSSKPESATHHIGDSLNSSEALKAADPDTRVVSISDCLSEQLRQLKQIRYDSTNNVEQALQYTLPKYVENAPASERLEFESMTNEYLSEAFGTDEGDEDYNIPNLTVNNSANKYEIAVTVLRALSKYFGIPYKRDSVEHAIKAHLREQPHQEFTIHTFTSLAELLDVKIDHIRVRYRDFPRLTFPALVKIDDTDCPWILWSSKNNKILVSTFTRNLELTEVSSLVSEDLDSYIDAISFSRSSYAKLDRFGLSWFLPTLKKYRQILAVVFLSSFFVQLLALLNPLLVQQIIDAVISQGNISSLNIYGTLLVGMAISEGVLSALRTFLLSDTTNRIDLSLGSMVIDHLMKLPLAYFAKRPVGEVSNRVNELEKIREFLTGTGLMSILDAIFALIYIGVMLLYSVKLTLCSLTVIPLFIMLAFVVAPLIKRQIERRSEAYARVQSHLVEALGGIETIKTQNLEYQSKWRWRDLYNTQIKRSFKTTVLATSASSISKFLEQLSGLIIIWIGASLVLKAEMTVGQLIAFRILSGYVTGPILRLATLWQNFQETGISMQRLGDVVNTPTEEEIHGDQLPPLPPIHGSIVYDNVSFRFANNTSLQLNRVSLQIDPGQFVGIVGGSGSGKSTLVKLLTRLYSPESGVIRIDGNDISKVDLFSLRRQIGIVPQDSLLFDGTIRDNISISRPDANLAEIHHALEIACASEFVAEMPSGIASNVGERGAGLSGGQRQRLAIARMLVSHPRLVVLDEATSALDVDTERRLLRNLTSHLAGITILFITHRISTIKDADKIIVMDKGIIDEVGSHNELLGAKGRYAALLHQQYSEGIVS